MPTTDDIDHDLLQLLLWGVTDAAVAAQLGISLRTVQRRIAELMDDRRRHDAHPAGRRGGAPSLGLTWLRERRRPTSRGR